MTTGATKPAWEAAALDDLAALARRLEVRLALDETLGPHTTMGVGGRCPAMLWPQRPSDVRALVAWMGRRGLAWRVIGGGSNLLVPDDGVDEPVLNLTALVEGERWGKDSIRFPAGLPTNRALRRSVARGFDGLVWASGLPGTLGGAAAGNAGCWGSDMAATVIGLEVVDARGVARELGPGQLLWAYRDLAIGPDVEGPVTIVGVEVRVRPGDPAALEQRYLDLQRRKREQQPVGARNSGCVFRNPDGDRSAGRLIDEARCKGMAVGAVEVSRVHANFLVNRGGATAADVLRLVEDVRSRVHETFGIDLVPEIRRW